ncbi:MAG: MFS transporter [Burkholderiaceae bacterium]
MKNGSACCRSPGCNSASPLPAAALLVSASGAGSALMMLPIGELADRWTRRTVLLGCASAVLVACLALPWAAHAGFPLAVAAFVWGGAGGALYTLAMIEIGHRHRGPDLIEATSVLVLAYTLGGLFGPAVAGAAIGVSPRFALPAVLAVIAALGLLALTRLLPRAPSRH